MRKCGQWTSSCIKSSEIDGGFWSEQSSKTKQSEQSEQKLNIEQYEQRANSETATLCAKTETAQK